MRTWGEERDAGAAVLRAAGIATAVLDADVLLAHVLGVAKETLYAHPDMELPHGAMRRYRELIARRANGEPVAYLRGFKEFYGLRFLVDQRVLIPRPETETIVDAARSVVAGRPLTVVDVGTGSGAIAVAVAVHERAARMIATDLSTDALEVAKANAVALDVADRVEFREGDLLSPISETVDVVVANLPYLRDDALEGLVGDRTSLAFEPRLAVAAGMDGLALICRASKELPRVLAARGVALFEVDPPIADSVADLLRGALGGTATVMSDLSGQPRVVKVTRPD
jgi:release factor glutamine methyltransferase